MPVLADFPPWFWFVSLVPFGLVLGSFLNVVIHRLPRGESIAFPASHCPACGKPIALRDNVPVFGYLFLRGRARCCGVAISPRYPLVELLGGLLAAAVVQLLVLELPPDTPLYRALLVFAVDLGLGLSLLALTFIDLEHMILPESLTYGGALLGFVSATLRGGSLLHSAIGAALGFLLVFLPFEWLHTKLRGYPGMGRGDANLTLLAGAWFGVQGAVFALFAGACQATLVTLVLYGVQGRVEEPESVQQERAEWEAEYAAADEARRAELEQEQRLDPLLREAEPGLGKMRVPFGPFLSLATLEYLLFEHFGVADLFEPLRALLS